MRARGCGNLGISVQWSARASAPQRLKSHRERGTADAFMRPYVICHMLSSVDGRIDGASLRAVMPDGEYEKTGAKLKGNAWICGRTTMQQHFAGKEPFISASNKPAGPHPV